MLGLAVPGGHNQVWQNFRLGKRRKFAAVEIGVVLAGARMSQAFIPATIPQSMTTHRFCEICPDVGGNGLIPNLLILGSQFHSRKTRNACLMPARLMKRCRTGAEGEEFVEPMQPMPCNPIVQQGALIFGNGLRAGLQRAGIGARIRDSGRRIGREWNDRKD